MPHDPTTSDGRGPDWQQRGGFSVFFDAADVGTPGEVWRSRLYHDETGAEVIEAGPDEEGWARWILARLAGDGPVRRPVTASVEVVASRIVGRQEVGGDETGGGDETVVVETEFRVRGRQALARVVIGELLDLLLDVGPSPGPDRRGTDLGDEPAGLR